MADDAGRRSKGTGRRDTMAAMPGAARRARARSGDALPSDVGARLRGIRERRGVGLRELSRRLGISASALSQIEHGRTRPSVTTLYAIVTELGISLDDVLRVPGATVMSAVVARPPIDEIAPSAVVNREGRRTIDLGSGVRWERLTPTAEPNADFLFVTYEVGASSSWEPIAVRHAGREYGLVLSGRIRIVLEHEQHELGPEDSIAFDTSVAHRVDNIGDEPAVAVWCMVGPPRA